MNAYDKVTELTATQVRAWLTEAGIDPHRQLTIEDRRVTSRTVDINYAGPWRTANEVRITGPKDTRQSALHVLMWRHGLAVAPYPDHDEWSVPRDAYLEEGSS